MNKTIPLYSAALILLNLMIGNILAQTDSVYTTDEIVVSASRYEENIENVSHSMSVIGSDRIEMKNPLNTANAFMGESGVWMQQTNHGGGSPFIRGLTGNQTLILIDGIRLNNSTFRYGPNQYLNTINVNDIHRIEILRGSGSVQYGSDALGGVVHIITKSPKIGLNNEMDGGVSLKYLSDYMEKSVYTYLDYSTSNSGYHASVSFKDLGDIVAGGNLGKESPSSYNEYSFNLKNAHLIAEKILFSYSYQYLRQNDINRFDQVAQRGYDYYKFDPQVRHMAYLKSEIFFHNPWAEKVSFNLSFQKSSETRKLKKNGADTEQLDKDVVDTWGANITVISKPVGNLIINSGVEYYFDNVSSKSSLKNILDNTSSKKRGLYADDSRAHNLSFFSLSNLILNDLELGFGIRYNIASLVINDDVFGEPKINPNAVTWNTSAAYNLSREIKLIAKINSAYRIPNINDVSSFGLFDYGIEVPNSDLSPERSFNYEVGLKYKNSILNASCFVFRTDLINLISRVEGTYNNQLEFQGETVYIKENLGEAYIQGIEMDLKYAIYDGITLQKNFSYTYGENETKNEPMRRIPPINGALSADYRYSNAISLFLEYIYALMQKRLSSGDLDDHRIDSNGTPGWNVLNIHLNYFWQNFTFALGVNNILDEAYRIHGSGIDGIGRSWQIISRYEI